jgi:hypothetical protein
MGMSTTVNAVPITLIDNTTEGFYNQALGTVLDLTDPNANLITNGGFETPDIGTGSFQVLSTIPGWTTSFGSGIEMQDHVAGSPFDGAQHVELDSFSNSGMLQQISTVAGQTYMLSFAYSPRPGVASDSNIIEIFFDNVLLDTLTASGIGLPDTSWSIFNYSVTATSGLSLLEFRAAGMSDTLGGYLDEVGLTAATSVPEPASLFLFCTGLLGLGFMHLSSKNPRHCGSDGSQRDDQKEVKKSITREEKSRAVVEKV